MYHSLTDSLRHSFTQSFTTDPWEDARYNESLFDKQAIARIEMENLKRINPWHPRVRAEREKAEEDEDERELRERVEQVKRDWEKKKVITHKVVTRGGDCGVDRKERMMKLRKEREEKEREETDMREKEERKFRELKTVLTHKILRNIRSVKYANLSTL